MNMSSSSEGSDLEVEICEENYQSDNDVPSDPIIRDQWVSMMFDDEEDFLVGDEFVGFQGEWTTERDNFVPRIKSPYRRQPGVKIKLPEKTTPNGIFSHIFTEELWTRLVCETNRYAKQKRATTTSPRSTWSPVTMAEMKTFVGLCLSMGVLQLPSRRDYWRQKKWLFQTNVPQVMSRDRFYMIWR